ncbi:MAG: glycosyltransferase N-terminal domain-containing protein, partial [Candidatus Competibacteraceae bacterium]|nr:glycosyltransferase N-terminal domain-containing protein [Candidatus Competibacteraceae bacterium]
MQRLYTLLLYASLPAILARLWWRGRRNPDYRRRWAERFGLIDPLPAPGALWIHGVSLGEVRAALPLVRVLQERYPRRPLLVTTTTPTGSRQVRESLKGVHHVYLPYDLPGAVERFLTRSRPALGVIMETELWPNLYSRCQRRGIPLVVANARLSARSARGYRRLGGLTRPMLDAVAVIAAQGEEDARRFRDLGARRVRLAGNLKYDLVPPPDLAVQGEALRESLGTGRPVLLAASTHQGEELLVLEAFEMLRRRRPDWLLVL